MPKKITRRTLAEDVKYFNVPIKILIPAFKDSLSSFEISRKWLHYRPFYGNHELQIMGGFLRLKYDSLIVKRCGKETSDFIKAHKNDINKLTVDEIEIDSIGSLSEIVVLWKKDE